MSKVKEKAIEYYPTLWSDERLKMLVVKGQLTKAEYKEVTGKDHDQSSEVEATADEENVSE